MSARAFFPSWVSAAGERVSRVSPMNMEPSQKKWEFIADFGVEFCVNVLLRSRPLTGNPISLLPSLTGLLWAIVHNFVADVASTDYWFSQEPTSSSKCHTPRF